MNIFFLHLNTKKCAEMHVDKHVVKMILESVQLLCSAHHLHPYDNYKPPYKLTHKNHPSAIWTRTSQENYLWLVSLAKELCKEYTYRYGKKHKCEQYLDDLEKNIPDIEKKEFTAPLPAMPDIYKNKITDDINKDIENVIESYKQYYFFEKSDLFSWKKRDTPDFIKEYNDLF
jgi:hypothetical protein